MALITTWWYTAASAAPMNGPTQNIQWSSHALALLKMIAAPRLLAGLMPVPVMGMVAECTKNTANPIGRGALESLDPKVRNRIDRLRAIQSHHDDLESKLFQELTSLKSNYHKLSAPFYSHRYDIVNGTWTEISLEDDDKKEEKSESGVPKFWLTAMKNNKDLASQITARDEGALVYLKDIKCSRIVDEVNQNPKGFRLDFYFDEGLRFSELGDDEGDGRCSLFVELGDGEWRGVDGEWRGVGGEVAGCWLLQFGVRV